jgi:hypothetical protein
VHGDVSEGQTASRAARLPTRQASKTPAWLSWGPVWLPPAIVGILGVVGVFVLSITGHQSSALWVTLGAVVVGALVYRRESDGGGDPDPARSPPRSVTGEATNGTGILEQQFDIRYQAHQATVNAIVENIIQTADYDGHTLGLQVDVAQTATEVDAGERKSLVRAARRSTAGDLIYGLMTVHQIIGGRHGEMAGVMPVRQDVEFPDVVLPNQQEPAQTVATLRGAQAASVETAVAMVHPHWTEDEVAREVSRIYAEENLDLMTRAHVMLSEPMSSTTPRQQQIEQLPQALDVTTIGRRAAFGNIGTAAAAARHYLETLHADLAGAGVYAGLLQISGPVGDSDAGNYVIETYGAANLPEPQNPADLADAMWDLYLKSDRFDQVFGA